MNLVDDRAIANFVVESKLPMLANAVVNDLIMSQPERPLDRVVEVLEGLRGAALLDRTPQPTVLDAQQYLQVHRIGPCIDEWIMAAIRARPQNLVLFSIQHFVRLRSERRWEPSSGPLSSSSHPLPPKSRELPPRPVLRGCSPKADHRDPSPSSATRSPAPASLGSEAPRSPSTPQSKEPITRRRRSSTQISVSSTGSAPLPLARRSSPLVSRFLPGLQPASGRPRAGSQISQASTPDQS